MRSSERRFRKGDCSNWDERPCREPIEDRIACGVDEVGQHEVSLFVSFADNASATESAASGDQIAAFLQKAAQLFRLADFATPQAIRSSMALCAGPLVPIGTVSIPEPPLRRTHAQTLVLMAQPKDARLTHELARQVCQRPQRRHHRGAVSSLGPNT